MNRRTTVVALALLLAGVTNQSSAQRSTTRGFHVGLGLNGSGMEIGVGNTPETGRGASLHVGYNFTPQLGILLTGARAKMDQSDGEPYTLGMADVTGRFTFANPAQALVPYVEIGYSGLSAQSEIDGQDVELRGKGYVGAGGVSFFLDPQLALDANLRYTWGKFTTHRVGDETVSNADGVGANAVRLNLGVTWYPGGGR